MGQTLSTLHPVFLLLAPAPDTEPHSWPLHTDSAVVAQMRFMRIPFLIANRVQIDGQIYSVDKFAKDDERY